LASHSFLFKKEIFTTDKKDFDENCKFLIKVAAKYGIQLELFYRMSYSTYIDENGPIVNKQYKVLQLKPIPAEFANYAFAIKAETYKYYQ